MTVHLLPYTGDRTCCSKCGHDEASTRYRPFLSSVELVAHQLWEVVIGDAKMERLCRVCARCGYHWDEALAARDDAAPFRGRVPLGRQFTTGIVNEPGACRLVVTHGPSGLHHGYMYPNLAAAEAGERPLWMFQELLNQVDTWQRQPLDAPADAGQEAR